MTYEISERFKSIQGEGAFCGTPMAFIRFFGCSVGKSVCRYCDTDFERQHMWRGGGKYSYNELARWTRPYDHVCLTGGEPLDQDLRPLVLELGDTQRVHLETSGTVDWPKSLYDLRDKFYICVSPKPGFTARMIELADEVKVIVPGLSDNDAWPTIYNTVEWARTKPVYLQPRNNKFTLDKQNLLYVQDILRDHPNLRLSVQMHKVLNVQ